MNPEYSVDNIISAILGSLPDVWSAQTIVKVAHELCDYAAGLSDEAETNMFWTFAFQQIHNGSATVLRSHLPDGTEVPQVIAVFDSIRQARAAYVPTTGAAA